LISSATELAVLAAFWTGGVGAESVTIGMSGIAFSPDGLASGSSAANSSTFRRFLACLALSRAVESRFLEFLQVR